MSSKADKDFTDKMMKVGKLLNINRRRGLSPSRISVTIIKSLPKKAITALPKGD